MGIPRPVRVVLLLLGFCICSTALVHGQTMVLTGNAVQTGPVCYRLTSSSGTERSAVWFPTQINLDNGFDIIFNIYMQNAPIGNNAGDGIAFVLQRSPSGTSALGEAGYSLGFAGYTGGGGSAISPSFAVELDIWDNTPTLSNEIAADHLSLIANGNIDVLINGPPVTALPGGANVTTGACRPMRVRWVPASDSLYVFFDNLFIPRIATLYDIRTPFAGNNNVWWGITGATGGVPIEQSVCFNFNQVGNDTTICSGANIQLNPGGTSNYTWSPAAGLSCNNCPSPTWFSPPPGLTTFTTLNSTPQGCILRDSLRLMVEPTPVADAGPDTVICFGDTVQIGTAGAAGFTYSWFPNSDISSNTVAQPFVWPAGNTNYAVTVVDTSGVANCSAQNIMQVTTVAPPLALAGTDTSLCDTFTVLNANAPGLNQSGLWTFLSGSGAFSNATDPNANVSALPTGNNQLIWTVSEGGCAASDTVQLNVNTVSLPMAGADTTLCDSFYTLSAQPPLPTETGLWSTPVPGPVIANSTQAVTGVTGLAPGNNVFVWTITSGACSRSDTVILFYVNAQAANAGADTTICGDTLQLYSNLPGGSTGNWSSISAGPVFSNPALNTATVSGLSPGPTILVWTLSSGSCSATDTMRILSYASIPANAGPDSTICGPVMTLQALPPVSGLGFWGSVPGGFVFSDSSNPNSLVTFPGPMTGQLVWTVVNGPCRNSDTAIVRSLFIVASAGIDTAICGNSLTLFAFPPPVGTGIWGGTGGVAFSNLNDPSATASNLAWGINTLLWKVTELPCSITDTVIVTAYQVPSAALAGPDQTISGSPLATLGAVLPAIGNGWWSSLTPGPVVTSPGNAASGVTGLVPGYNLFQWTVTNGPCPSSSDQMQIYFAELQIPTGFSPNGDGVNDFFELPGLPPGDAVSLTVFNRWGNEVYANANYQNEWSGNNAAGQALADDTYFVVIEIGGIDPYKGYVVIKR